ncbi:MAG: hypothetical protein AN484_28090, partial [Aphanizomenon flos-aquae WA102]
MEEISSKYHNNDKIKIRTLKPTRPPGSPPLCGGIRPDCHREGGDVHFPTGGIRNRDRKPDAKPDTEAELEQALADSKDFI